MLILNFIFLMGIGDWGVNKDDDIFYRKGLSDSNHIG